jgi:hypothetical protein
MVVLVEEVEAQHLLALLHQQEQETHLLLTLHKEQMVGKVEVEQVVEH